MYKYAQTWIYIKFRWFEMSELVCLCFTSGSRIFRSYKDVTITGVELQNGGLWLEPTVFEQNRSSLWVTPLRSHPKDCPNIVALNVKHGVLRTYTYSTSISNGTVLCEKERQEMLMIIASVSTQSNWSKTSIFTPSMR